MKLTILWDNDGVLVNTEGLYFQASRKVLHSVGVEFSREQFQEISLRRGESTFAPAAEAGIGAAEIDRLRLLRDRLYGELLQAQSCVIDGVEEVLQTLHGRVRMGVVTGSRRDQFELAHARSGLTQYMDFVLTREDYEHSKPHPEAYVTAMKRHGLRPSECIVVEDSERGLAAARAAGLSCLVVRSEWTAGSQFPGACKVLESIREVPGEVLRLDGEDAR